MTCNKNGIPNDPQKPMVTSGIRLGTPAFTTRGFNEEETRPRRNLIADVLDKPNDEANIAAVRAKVAIADPRTSRSTAELSSGTAPMRCPFCSHEDTTVVETRDSDEGDVVRRRRRCQSCDKRFTTYEHAEISLPQVVKKDGTRTEFDPAKVRASMTLALRKRPVSVEQIDAAMVGSRTSCSTAARAKCCRRRSANT